MAVPQTPNGALLLPSGAMSIPWQLYFQQISDYLDGLAAVGSYQQSAAASVGMAWLACDGGNFVIAKYPALYAVLAGITAAGTVSGTWKLPNITPVFDAAHPGPGGPPVVRWFIKAV